MTTFETGATTAQANNLVLSVMNNGAAYEDRLHCGYAMLQGGHHRMTFRELIVNEATKQRTMGCTFKPAAISEAAKIVQDLTIDHCLESIRNAWNGEHIHFYGRKWRDNVNGNTYFSARIVIPTESGVRWVAVSFQYGYGDQWIWECRAVLKRMGFDINHDAPLSELPIDYIFEGVMLKRQMYQGIL